ncbi:L-asparaginase [Rhipicephalus microplus]|uniref:L-asparaginase n=1 Tax=Rhipicephalus microplus TaxID=6941 RepID=UPI003F6CD3F4
MAVVAPMDASYVPKVLHSLTDEDEAWRKYATNDEACVLVIYTGGTIGMVKDDDGVLRPAPGILDKRLREFPQLHDQEYAKEHFGDCEKPPLVLPVTGDPRRVIYTIAEYDPLLDSSNATMDDWLQIAADIKKYYDSYQGFIVLHGTDTMAYTSSALSFLLENLGKSVVVTGSQIPVFEPRSDGRDNILNSLIVAGNYVIPEVTLMFHNQLFRGNRVSKFSISHLDAFASFNMAPLITIGINIEITWRLILPDPKGVDLRAHDKLNRDVGLLRLFPSITAELVEAFLKPPIEGVVLQTYGAGNAPTARKDIMEALRSATKRGVLILNCSQCQHGAVDPAYETGNELVDVGVIPGGDMTPEAGLTKLAYVLAKSEWTLDQKKKKLQESLRGELTTGTGDAGWEDQYKTLNLMGPWKALFIR